MAIPVPANDEARVARLRSFGILDTPPEEAFDRVARIAASVLETPIALVSLVDESRQWFKARHGLAAVETPRELAFCAHAIIGTEVMVVSDALQDPRFASNPLVLEGPKIRFYAGAPLRTSDGYNLGTLCAIDQVPRHPTLAQTALLEDLAALVIDELELRVAGAMAVRELRARERAETSLQEQRNMTELLHVVAASANEAREPGALLQQTLAHVCKFAGWGAGCAWLLPRDGSADIGAKGYWYCRESLSADAVRSQLEARARAGRASGLAAHAAYGQRLEVVGDLETAPGHWQTLWGCGFRAAVGLPVIVGSRLAAVLEFYADAPPQAEPRSTERALMNVASHVALVIERDEVTRMKDEFVSTVSHELRTPLTSIRGAVGLVKNGVTGPVAPEAVAMLDIAYQNTDRLVRLVNDLLDVQKMASGSMTFSMEPLGVPSLIEQGLEANRSYYQQMGLSLRVEGAIPDLVLTGDKDRLVQVLTNLLSNAAKFSPAGGEVVVIAEHREGTLRISVRDNGPGIPDTFRSQMFGRFAQADLSPTRQKGGTGLGLSICRMIVEHHHGVIDYTTSPGRGTTFVVDLPLADAASIDRAHCA